MLHIASDFLSPSANQPTTFFGMRVQIVNLAAHRHLDVAFTLVWGGSDVEAVMANRAQTKTPAAGPGFSLRPQRIRTCS
ncbi:hypothetical protein [Mesorhizobium sp.]|uniref:hypothetical protein n=1 Tax=Mesorhizobium sp. TaxID=1871066 RepID=UPI000FE7DCBA|nr:hypothetical protein [Mesorhizobium sp.]RWC45666.1 MAG: hypothetical protein EOS28_07060 [Mesorhizobium sp.]RWF02203.1 MAG: hypothetical protein EOS68_06445 [Mesorhizobium sp.]